MQLISLLPVENYNYRGIKTMIACRSFTIVLLWSTTTSMSTYEDHFDLSGASAPYESSGENPNEDDIFTISDWKRQSFSNPHIRVARWMDSDDNVMVGCVHKGQQRGRFFLTVTGGANITIVDPHIITFKASFFNITVTPPVSITCVLNTLGQNLTSEEYTLGAHCVVCRIHWICYPRHDLGGYCVHLERKSCRTRQDHRMQHLRGNHHSVIFYKQMFYRNAYSFLSF
ncbi:uncharacterized protein LOC134086886 isoform X2 [Sardina pilchardus]|uniref:uncharacterized protein LOC134086886 isoform X2 n=1 Tax=Sardina pilchardus TaxID=27697 RepID=UPI002E103778